MTMTLSRFVFVGAACAALTNILVIGLAGFGIHYFFRQPLLSCLFFASDTGFIQTSPSIHLHLGHLSSATH